MGVRIGFDDDDFMFDEHEEVQESEETLNDEEYEADLNSVFLRPERVEQFLKDYDCVVVQEFGDEYHLTEEERIAKNKFYETFKEYSKYKHRFNTVPEYIEAMRAAIKCLNFMGENNGVYEPEKFKSMVLKGKIQVGGLTFPKLKNKVRKKISPEYLSEYILSDLPADEFTQDDDEEILDDDELDEIIDVIFDKNEIEYYSQNNESPVEASMEYLDNFTDLDNLNVALEFGRKENKDFIKNYPDMVSAIKDMKHNQNSKNWSSQLAASYISDDMDEISSYDEKYYSEHRGKMPKFKGDFFNDDDFNKYLLELEEFDSTNTRVIYHGKAKTLEEIDEIEKRAFFESHGWNVKNMYEAKEEDNMRKKLLKEQKKKRDALKKKFEKADKLISAAEEGKSYSKIKKRYLGEDFDSEKGKKKDKKKKKGKDKLKKHTQKDIDSFLLGTSGKKEYDSFKKYSKDALDFTDDDD